MVKRRGLCDIGSFLKKSWRICRVLGKISRKDAKAQIGCYFLVPTTHYPNPTAISTRITRTQLISADFKKIVATTIPTYNAFAG